MKVFYLAIISISIAGCSNNSAVETKNNAPTSGKDSTAINSATATNETANASLNPNVGNEANAQSNDVKIRSLGVINKENAEALKQVKVGDADAATIRAVPLKNAAPDGSEISSRMNNEGIPVETRIFKNNPLLSKIEKILADPANPTLKVYLKNGKTVSFPASKISDSVSASANEILIAAGAIPKNAPTENNSKELTKKSAN